LKRHAREQEEATLRQERELFAELFEVLDLFDNIEKNIQSVQRKQGPLDKTSLALLNSLRAVRRKLLRLLSSRQILPLEFADGRAQMEQCRILETRPDPARLNEEILSIEKQGYVDARCGVVLRKAEVVTVCNDRQEVPQPTICLTA
jgi:molecular chaperone GrpE (heat shock protein)